PFGEISDQFPARLVDALSDEPLQLTTIVVEHADRRVARAGDRPSDRQQPVENTVQVQLGAQGRPRLDQLPQLIFVQSVELQSWSLGARNHRPGTAAARAYRLEPGWLRASRSSDRWFPGMPESLRRHNVEP